MPVDHRLKIKESEKRDKYLDQDRKLGKGTGRVKKSEDEQRQSKLQYC